ncbi:MAG: hypothetical protein E5W82_10165 [Mesorhizobium sp.]|nr:MAG: hypothetical protein E5W82_10165 [Mesorhizobium sp.]
MGKRRIYRQRGRAKNPKPVQAKPEPHKVVYRLDTPERRVSYFWFEVAKFCACGNPASLLEEVRDALAAMKIQPIDPDAHELLMLYWLDNVKLTEHGGGIYGSWLSPAGEDLLRDLQAINFDEDRDIPNSDYQPGETS